MSPLEHLQSAGPDILLVARFAIAWILSLTPALGAEGASPPTAALPGAGLFADNQVLRLRLELRPEDMQSLREENRRYVRSTIRAGDDVYREVGIHLKGATGSFHGLDDKPGLTLDFGRFTNGQRFQGLRKIHLNNSVEDPSYLNEKIGSELFRAAGL